MRSILPLLFMTLATPALAVDGVLEINQTCAVQTGCFLGDTAGFPVVISVSGSYRLTSNLVVPDENTTGIEVNTSNISIDLNGFEIAGANSCSGTPVTSCTFGASGNGVHAESRNNIEVRNGTVRGMGGRGIQLNNGSLHRVIGVRAAENGARGIYVSTNATVTGCSAFQNRSDGIFTAGAAHVEGNTIYGNGLNGINSISTSLIVNNTIISNGGDGIRTGGANTILGNLIRSNTGNGINSIGTTSGYGTNVIEGNGNTVVNGVEMTPNICSGSLTCP